MDEVFADPQVKHTKMAVPAHHPKLGDIELVGQAIKLSRTPFEVRSATPELGEHTDTVLRELGYADGDIRGLHERGAV